MRLVDCEPAWWQESGQRYGQGLTFLCPCCHRVRLAIAFVNPLDGGAPAAAHLALWRRSGETFATLTARPEVDAEKIGHWRGTITEGRMEDV